MRQQNKGVGNSWLIIVIAVAAVLSARPVHADIDWFPYTYSWETASKGELELELSHTQPTSGRNWQDTVSAEYGVTDRYMIEPYLVFNRSGGFRDIPTSGGTGDGDEDEGSSGSQVFDPILNGQAYRYGGFKVEQRYRFGDFGYRKLLAAGYLEYEQLRGAKPELESKLILQYEPNSSILLAFNLINETALRGEKPEWGYSFGATNRFEKGHGNPFWLGAEAFGNWTENQDWIGPSAGVFLNDSTRLTGTYGFQLRGSGGDQFKVMLNHDF